MDAWENLKMARSLPGEDESWLSRGWLAGSIVTPDTRATLVDWLLQCGQYLSLSDVSLHLAVANFDLVLSEVQVEEEEVQLLALTCLHLAAKVEEDCPPAPELLLPLTGGAYTKADLARLEREAISALKWGLRRTTAVVFLHYYTEILGRGGRAVLRCARAILDLCLHQTWYGTVQPGHLATTALLAASYLEGGGWSEEMVRMTGQCPSQLMGSLATVLNMVTGPEASIPDGVRAKHEKAVSRIEALGADRVRVIVKNVQEEVQRVSGPGQSMILL